MGNLSRRAEELGERDDIPALPLVANRNPAARAVLVVGRFVRQKPLAGFGLLICIILVTVAVFADVVSTHHHSDSVGGRLESPSSTHWMGTDRLGRDTYSRIVYGARVSIYVGLGSVAVALAVAMAVGVLSASGPPLVDMAMQRLVDAFMAFPPLVFLLTLTAIIGPSLPGIIVVLGLLLGIGASRVVRSAVFGVSSQEYILAARSTGCSYFRIQWRHIVPNIFPTVIVMGSVTIGVAILAEAAISFLGFGVPPPSPSWGQMLSTDLVYMIPQPWLAFWPGAAITLTVFAFNVLGDGLRDVLDPRLRGR